MAGSTSDGVSDATSRIEVIFLVHLFTLEFELKYENLTLRAKIYCVKSASRVSFR